VNNKGKTVLITPEMAEQLLYATTKNRPINHAQVEAYKQAILNGQWVLPDEETPTPPNKPQYRSIDEPWEGQ